MARQKEIAFSLFSYENGAVRNGPWSSFCNLEQGLFYLFCFIIILTSLLTSYRESQRNTGQLKEQKNMGIYQSHSCLLKNFLNMSFQPSR